jgi:hypothetical protein
MNKAKAFAFFVHLLKPSDPEPFPRFVYKAGGKVRFLSYRAF